MLGLLALLCFIAFAASAPCGPGDYSYEHQDAWGDLVCDDNMCSEGTTQSPIVVQSRREASADQLKPLRFTGYEDSTGTFSDANDYIFYDYSVSTAQFRPGNQGVPSFSPVGFLFHTPAEHVLPGHADQGVVAELQFFHLNADSGAQAAISFFYTVGAENSLLSFLNPNAADVESVTITGLDSFLEDVFSNSSLGSYYYYAGSTTVPPCTEPVYWYLVDNVFELSQDQLDAITAVLSSSSGNARSSQRTLNSVLYWDASAYAVTDAVCGGGVPQWVASPYDCTGQYDGTKCFYCSGKANGLDAVQKCLPRNGGGCNALFNTPEADAYCNIAFECTASTFSQSFVLLAFLAVLLAVQHFGN